MAISVLLCLAACCSAATYLLPQHTLAVKVLVTMISPQHPPSAPLGPESGQRPWRQRRGRRVLRADRVANFVDKHAHDDYGEYAGACEPIQTA